MEPCEAPLLLRKKAGVVLQSKMPKAVEHTPRIRGYGCGELSTQQDVAQ